jgi:hypothetical protein
MVYNESLDELKAPKTYLSSASQSYRSVVISHPLRCEYLHIKEAVEYSQKVLCWNSTPFCVTRYQKDSE